MAAAVLVAEGVPGGVPVGVAPVSTVRVAVCVPGGLPESVAVGDGERVRVRGWVRVRLAEALPVWLGDGVGVLDMRLEDGVPV